MRSDLHVVLSGKASEGRPDRIKRTVVIRVRDHRRWQQEVDPGRGHYGLRLMEALMDAVEVERSQQGTVITLRGAILPQGDPMPSTG